MYEILYYKVKTVMTDQQIYFSTLPSPTLTACASLILLGFVLEGLTVPFKVHL